MGTTRYLVIGIDSWQFPLVPGKKFANLAGVYGKKIFQFFPPGFPGKRPTG